METYNGLLPEKLPATLSGYILVYKKEQESDNLVPRVRLRIRTYDVLVSFLRAYRDYSLLVIWLE